MAHVEAFVRRLLVLSLIVVGVGFVAVPAAQPASAYTTIFYNGAGANAATIGLIGDSSFAGVRWLNSYAPLKRYNFALDAESCRRTTATSCRGREGYAPANGITTLQRLNGRFDDVLVMVTGYNDPGVTFGASVDRIMAEAVRQGIGKVVWLTMRTASVSYVSPGYRSNATTFKDNNRILLQKAHVYNGRLQIADWATYSTPTRGWVTPDGVHLTRSGTIAVTDFIADQVAQVLAGRRITPSYSAPALCRVGVPLRVGDNIDDVRCLETYLRDRGVFRGMPDKRYDAATAAAVNQINALQRWPQAGIAGRGVLETLGAWRGETLRPFCNIPRSLAAGSQGGDVSCLARRLSAAGYQLPNTTTYGLAVHEAVAHFRRRIGMTPNGPADPTVLIRLGVYRPPCRIHSRAPLRPGQNSANVRCLRQFLTGFGRITPTNVSVYDATVTNHVKALERWQQLPVDGIADTTLLSLLGALVPTRVAADATAPVVPPPRPLPPAPPVTTPPPVTTVPPPPPTTAPPTTTATPTTTAPSTSTAAATTTTTTTTEPAPPTTLAAPTPTSA